MPDLSSFDYRHAALLAATLISIANYSFYLRAIYTGKFKPHMFSWIIWTLLSVIAFAAQWSEDAGPGMYQIAVMALGTALVAIAAFFYGDRHYTKSDWLSLGFAFAAIPAWIVTDHALYAVIIITAIDAVGMWPTVRKSWNKPRDESPGVFFTSGLICVLGIAALDVFNTVTLLYSGALVALNWGFVMLLYYRRARVKD